MKTSSGKSARRKVSVVISGIPIHFQWTWFIFMAVTMAVVGGVHLPRAVPQMPWWMYFASSLTISLILAMSLVLHELSHSLVAIRAGVPVPQITLHLFGGLSRIQTEAQNPKDDAWIAAAGPLCSLLFAVAFVCLAIWLPLPRPSLRWYVIAYAAYVNIVLVIFNMIPGLPLDGGRILRAFLWWRSGSIVDSTKKAAAVGRLLAYAVALWGIYQMLQGHYVGGSFNVVIGMFMRNAASMTVDFTFMDTAMRAYSVRQAMIPKVTMIPPDTTIGTAVEEYFLHHGDRAFLVGDGKQACGMVLARDVKAALGEGRHSDGVTQHMVTDIEPYFVTDADRMLDVYTKMTEGQYQRMFVGSPQDVRGVVTHAGIVKYSEMLKYLEIPISPRSAAG